ncbi:MAG TPA: DnaB-like helicase N-terminal domain-containing protein [Stenotrophomonas sp.]|jgi:replicative DNA helicase
MNPGSDLDRMAALYGPGTEAAGVRVPPHSVDAERAVLGGLMLRSKAWWQVSGVLTENDFYRRDHRLIWRAMKELAASDVAAGSRKEFDTVTVGDWFESRGLLEQVGEGAYLLELASTTPSAANIRGYADIVADKARLRRLIDVGTEMVNDGFQPDGRSSIDLVGEAQSRMAACSTTSRVTWRPSHR